MALTYGLDYSYSHPVLTCAADAGFSFVARYIGDSDPNSAKYLDAGELSTIRAAGLSVVVVRETTAGFMIFGDGAGHARDSRAHCDALGLYGIPIYYALDVDPRSLSPAESESVTRFLESAALADGGGHNVGLYGAYEAMERWVGQPFCWWGWQTYAWSAGRVSSKAHFRQYLNGQNICGGTVDLNETYVADFGQWPRPSPPPVPVPSLEDIMPFPVVAAEVDQIERPWTALLPGNVVRFANTEIPPGDDRERIAPSWEYYAGVATGFYAPVKRYPAGQYDQAIAAAKGAALVARS